ncbi:hypothetical protein ACJRO7_035525 [Eucalyptus globulus]|uniref:RING-type domain-containing protein n=1 Tax=Eucalyptus globulus TaxID=34317 RepID=A0ABD3JCZ6_EUCGL
MPPSPYPTVAPAPRPPHRAVVGLCFTPFTLYALSLACADAVLLLIMVGYAYCFLGHKRVKWIDLGRSIYDLTRPIRLTGLMVMKYCGNARQFSNDECVICLAIFEEGEECWVIKTCDHVYRKKGHIRKFWFLECSMMLSAFWSEGKKENKKK